MPPPGSRANGAKTAIASRRANRPEEKNCQSVPRLMAAATPGDTPRPARPTRSGNVEQGVFETVAGAPGFNPWTERRPARPRHADIEIAGDDQRIGAIMLRSDEGRQQVDLTPIGLERPRVAHGRAAPAVEMGGDDVHGRRRAGNIERDEKRALVRQAIETGAGEARKGQPADPRHRIVGQIRRPLPTSFDGDFTTPPVTSGDILSVGLRHRPSPASGRTGPSIM
jgi:hypothetical protein